MEPTVRTMMSNNVETLSQDATVYEAAVLMHKLDIGSVPIIADDVLVGMLTDRDIVLRVVAAGREANNVHVSEVMTTDIVTAAPDWTMKQAAHAMAEAQIRRLPVVEDTRLVGILSLGDFAVEGQKDAVSGEVLTEISQPTSHTK